MMEDIQGGAERHLILLGAFDEIVCPGILIGCNEVWIIYAWQGSHALHVRDQLPLQLKVQNLHSKPLTSSLPLAYLFSFSYNEARPCVNAVARRHDQQAFMSAKERSWRRMLQAAVIEPSISNSCSEEPDLRTLHAIC